MPLEDFITEEWEDEELERAKKFKERWDLYEGRHPDTLPVVRGTEGRPDVNDNVKYNASGLTVKRGVSALMGGLDQEIMFALQEESGEDSEVANTETEASDEIAGDPGDSPDQAWLEAAWTANSKVALLQNIATNGGVCGHFFVRLYEKGAKFDPSMPRILNLDPAYCCPVWDEDDYDVLLGYKIQFPTMNKRVRRTLIEPDVEDLEDFDPTAVEKWLITDQVSIGESRDWETLSDPVTWDYPFAPILDAQNLPKPNEYWGMADIEDDVAGLNLAMNRALSSMQRILRLYGHPRPWVAGVSANQIGILIQGVDRIITLPDNAVLNQLEMTGDLSGALDFLRQLKSAFSDIAANPQVDPEKLGTMGGLSGVALRILYQPLLEQTGTKRGTYGPFLQELNRRVLVLGNITPSPVTVRWPDPLPKDVKETTEALVAARELGLSQETALETLGHDPALEEERRQNDASGMGVMLAAGAAGAAAIKAGVAEIDPAAAAAEATATSAAFNGGTGA